MILYSDFFDKLRADLHRDLQHAKFEIYAYSRRAASIRKRLRYPNRHNKKKA